MLIYLDTCCFNRPFDDQSQLLIRLQTEAKLYAQDAIRQGAFSLAWSAVMDLENVANPDNDLSHSGGCRMSHTGDAADFEAQGERLKNETSD